ncbi:MAG: protein kinase [Gemmatimonadota bacterium]
MSLEQLATALADKYRIIRELGAGGMATVYLAEDIKHQRNVAVKVLNPELSNELAPERFLREIATTANLRHPHILPLFDSGACRPGQGEGPAFLYYVMPLVEGQSLRTHLDQQRQLPVDEAITIAREVGEALEHAHQHNIIHRDIKPDNILLDGGHAVVADFGIARAIGSGGTGALTQAGVSVGTPLYMSPEQAAGETNLDGRSDQYALGCVLYEMLGGQPPFTGPTAESIVRQHMVAEPAPITNLRSSVPPHVASAIARALEKNPADRFNATGQFVQALTSRTDAPVARAGSRTLVIGGIAASILLTAAIWLAGRKTSQPLHVTLGRSEQFTAEPGLEIQPALSPDGKFVAFAQGNPSAMRIFIRPVGGGRTVPLADDSTSVETHPVWSPDGSQLLFLTKYNLSIAPALGGSSRILVPAPKDLTSNAPRLGVTAGTWSPDGRDIAFARADSLFVIPVNGGDARLVASGVEELHSCAWSPDGKWIACVSRNVESVFPGQGFGNLSPTSIVLFAASGGAGQTLIPSGMANLSPAWTSDSRHLLFVSTRDGPRDVYSQELSASGRAVGGPVRISTGLETLSISLSADGTRMAYTAYSADANLWSWPMRAGATVDAKRATRLTTSHQVIEFPSVSRDGRWLLFDSNIKGNADIFRIPIAGGVAEQLTRDSADEFGPDLSPDGKEVAYHVWRNGTRDIAVQPLAGGPVHLVAASPTQESFPSWSPDGHTIVFWDQTPDAPMFTVKRKPDGTWEKPVRLLAPALFPAWSPDGQEIVYSTQPPGRTPELMAIRPAGGAPRKLYQPGPNGPWAEKAAWSPDGKTVYFKSHDAQHRTAFYAVPAAGGTPRLVARLDDPSWQSIRVFFATDGIRLFFPVEDRQSDIYIAVVAR